VRGVFSFFLFLIFLVSCSSLESNKGLQRLDMNEYYREAGMGRYFLPSMPQWLNYSESGQCERTHSIVYLDFEALKKGQALSYEQSLQLQLLFNLSREEKILATQVKALPNREEEGLFFESLQKVQAGFYSFIRPKFNRLHLVWIDGLFKDEENIKKLKKLMQKDFFMKGQAIFISQCYSKNEVEKMLEKNELMDANIRVISMELFSVYNAEAQRQKQFLIDLNQLFNTKQELHLFLMGQALPKEFVGKFEVHP